MVRSLHRLMQKFGPGSFPLILFVALLALSGCGGSTSTTPTTDSNSPITVWVDATRLAGAKLYAQKHPNVKVTVVTVDRATLPQKVLLFNRTGSGWPDVVFAEPDLLTKVEDAAHHFPADLTPYVSQDIISKFAQGALAGCQVNGKLYCLRNDLAQEVLWYNAKLMKQFNYTVPTTWEEYQALGLKVAKEHPGYVIGSFGDSQALNMYFWPSRCPVKQLSDTNTVHINLSNPTCTRVSALVDPLIKNGTISKLGPFDPGFVKLGTQNKILMLPAASWYGQYVFKPTYKTPNGELSVAAPLKWASEDTAWTGAQGGAAWAMSSHTKNPKAASDMVIWMTTSNDNQANAVTFPAYLPAADAWEQTISSDPFYASNPYPVLKQAASLIDPKWGSVRFDTDTTFGTVVIAGITHGKSVADTLNDYQSQLDQLAQASGYTVMNS